jgi:hypothetical protein
MTLLFKAGWEEILTWIPATVIAGITGEFL